LDLGLTVAIGPVLDSFGGIGSLHSSMVGRAIIDLAVSGNSQHQSNWH
jgi:hypothetical protein